MAKSETNYGMIIRTISKNGVDNPQSGAVSKHTLFKIIEQEYSKSDGWEVYASNFIGETPDGYNVIYFLKK